ncbi:MAG: prepilin peptidase [Chloroflexi bacterium]|nr:prepilin peptidase [Chloroflexota bacterium]
MTLEPVLLVVGGGAGAAWGLVADRISARWPAHPGGVVRAVDWRTVAVAIASGVTFALLLARWPELADRVVLGIYLGALMVLLATDLDQRLLPDVITLPLVGYALVVVVLGLDPLVAGKDLGIASSIVAGIAAPALLLLTDRLFGGALGMGDVKLAVSLGLMAGITRLVTGFLLATIAGAVVLVGLMALGRLSRRSIVPFGPILIGAGVIAALLP